MKQEAVNAENLTEDASDIGVREHANEAKESDISTIVSDEAAPDNLEQKINVEVASEVPLDNVKDECNADDPVSKLNSEKGDCEPPSEQVNNSVGDVNEGPISQNRSKATDAMEAADLSAENTTKLSETAMETAPEVANTTRSVDMGHADQPGDEVRSSVDDASLDDSKYSNNELTSDEKCDKSLQENTTPQHTDHKQSILNKLAHAGEKVGIIQLLLLYSIFSTKFAVMVGLYFYTAVWWWMGFVGVVGQQSTQYGSN